MNNSNKQTIASILGKPISREEVFSLLRQDTQTYQTFLTFPPEEREKLLSFIEGNSGLQITYDSFFKKIFDPYTHPNRLERFLSAVLKQKVKIKVVLPNEGSKLSAIGSLVIMDIVLELENGSIIDVEMQKIGYAFPGERSDCYIADFIMRQYNRVKSERGKSFSFRDMCPVYLIVLMESSSKEFSLVAPKYIHRKQICYDSGVQINNLSNIVYISLDTFRSSVQNISIELDAWLTFLSSDKPSDIIKLVTAFPKFKEYYQDIVDFRHNPKELIYMYSEALAILDYNTTQYMIDELKTELQDVQERLQETKKDLAEVTTQKETTSNINMSLTNENKSLTNENKSLSNENKALKKELEDLKAQLLGNHT